MQGGLHRPPAGYTRSLRRLTEVPGLWLEFDPEEAEKSDAPAWKVMVRQKDEEHVIVWWPHNLDGNLEALARRVSEQDHLRNGGAKAYARRVYRSVIANEREKERRFRDTMRGIADYSRDAFRKLAYDEERIR